MPRTIAETLRRVPLFSELPAADLERVAASAILSRFDEGQIIFNEGDTAGDVWIVQEGTVKVYKIAASGRSQLIAIERSGSSLGEVSASDGGPYSATAIAASPTTLLRLSAQRFIDLCASHPVVALQVIRVLGRRLRSLRRLVEEISFATVRDRLIAHLLSLAAARGASGGAGIEIELDENNEEIAARLGTVRELVSRNLGRLHGEGLIVMRKRAVTIPDESLLRASMKESLVRD